MSVSPGNGDVGHHGSYAKPVATDDWTGKLVTEEHLSLADADISIRVT